MNVHCTIATELGRQRQAQIHADIAACRRTHQRQRRWWEPGFLRSRPGAATAEPLRTPVHTTA